MMGNRILNCGFAKPINTWLGRQFLVQTFDEEPGVDITEIRRLLDDEDTNPAIDPP